MPINDKMDSEELKRMRKEQTPPAAPPPPPYTRAEMSALKRNAINKLLRELGGAYADGTLKMAAPPKPIEEPKDGNVQNLE